MILMQLILEIAKAILGIALIFFIPGYIIEKYFIKSNTTLEKIVLSITLSITTTILLGLILGLLNIFNYWTSLIGFVIIIFITIIANLFLTKLKQKNKLKNNRKK